MTFRTDSSALPTLLVALLVLACDRAVDQEAAAREQIAAAARQWPDVEMREVDGAMLTGLPQWRIADAPDLSIGRRDGDEPYLFSRPFAAFRLESGEIVVADGQTLEFRVFDSAGAFQRRYGGKGQGPGQFMGFPLNVSEPDGTRIAVYDYPLARVTALDLSTGDFTTQRLTLACGDSTGGTAATCDLARLLPDGTAFAYRTRRRPPVEDAGIAVVDAPARLFGILTADTLKVLDSLPAPTSVRIGFGADFFSGTALFRPGGSTAFTTDEMILGDPHTYIIRRWDSEGQLRHLVRVLAPRQPVTDEFLERLRTWADTAPNIPAVSRQYLASVRPEGTIPFYEAIRADRAGRIWLQDYQPFWAFGPRRPAMWTVLRRDGTPIARVSGGPSGEILEAGEDYVLMREADELGVEYVRMYRLERP
jgi:hypothetical protein